MWRFINTGYSSGALNMAFDERLVSDVSSGELDGAVRVYGWTPPCISLGYHQTVEILNLEKCVSEGIDVVRRPTGGRAVLHWDELTYSVVLKANGRSLSEVYHEIGLALVCGLRQLDDEISLARSEPRVTPALGPTSSLPCYASIARYEIQYRGKKLVGSAQRRYTFSQGTESGTSGEKNEIVLQHGSILIGPAHRRIVDFLAIHGGEATHILEKEVEEKSTELSSILGRSVEFAEVAECIKRGFEEEWRVPLEESIEEYHTLSIPSRGM